MVKIAFFDVDGTLFEVGGTTPSKKTIYALQQLQKNGVLVCMATGRSYCNIPEFEGFDFDIIMSFNGSFIRNKKEIIYSNPLDEKDKFRVISNLDNMNRALAIASDTYVVTNGSDKELKSYFADMELIVSDNFDNLCKDNIYQMMCSCTEDEYETILNGTDKIRITAWWDKAADIIPYNSGKGLAVQKVLEYYNLTPQQAIAFGDGGNDIEMLKAVGCGIAMGNAKDDVKQNADVICKSVNEDGVYYYCLENNLI